MDNHHHYDDAFIPTRPYTMCRQEECQERQGRDEVSIWECTRETRLEKFPRNRILNPLVAVSKYRRSAAGVSSKIKPRSLNMLQITLHYLFQILIRQCVYSRELKENRQSLLSTVEFVNDRIRALQVDLVKTQQVPRSARSIQVPLVRYHVITMYLLSGKKNYQVKFAIQALWTAVSAYWTCNGDCIPVEIHDEMLCLTILIRVAFFLIRDEPTLANNTAILRNEFAHGGYSSMLQDYWTTHTTANKYRQLALKVAIAAHVGHYRLILSLLTNIQEFKFGITCRCCMAPALNVIRLGTVRQYNKSCRKGEMIHGQEMARLLFLPNAQDALEFCHGLAGLPLDKERIVLKMAPISISNPSKLTWACRQDDVFVFGLDQVKKWQETMHGNWRESARIDQDGVFIPPGNFLASLLQLENA